MSAPFRTTCRVEFRDTDAAGIAHFSVYFTYMEEAEHELWRSLGLSVKHTADGEIISWPRVSAHCDYHGPLRFEDVVDIEVVIEQLGEKSVTFGFHLGSGSRRVATGRVTAVCCRFPQDAPPQSIAIPEDIREKLQPLVTT